MKEEVISLLKELVIPIVTCIVSGLISYIVSALTASKWLPAYRNKYEELRIDVSETLNLYARLYNNPVDIAKEPGGRLPSDYREASEKLRELASKMRTLSEIIPCKKQKIPTRGELQKASDCLFGLSNSLTTPFHSNVSDLAKRNTHEYECELRRLLRLSYTRE